jgi:hypothetical protein
VACREEWINVLENDKTSARQNDSDQQRVDVFKREADNTL